jgi:putative transposase
MLSVYLTGILRACCIERFWRSAKCERIYLNEYQSISELITDVDDYIELYNHRRFHETLAYKKPMDVYQESIKLNGGNHWLYIDNSEE